jgi:hypothetical protein
MSNAVGLDRAVEYVTKLETFRTTLESQDKGCTLNGDTVRVEKGRKFDKVYIQTWHDGKPNQRLGRYMVDRNSWVIYGIKSWAQINERRTYGTLDTVDQYDWSSYYGAPKSGTEAETLHLVREAEIAKQFKPRGRPRKTP